MHVQPPPNRLRELIERRNLRLMDVAAACKVYPSTVTRWQDSHIPRRHVAQVAQVLGVSVPYLDGWVDEDEAAA